MIFEGNNFVDDRGILSFVNSFDFNGIKRFYQIKNHKIIYIRAWHAHKNETKYFYVTEGSILLGQVNLETNEIKKNVISNLKPSIIKIPANHANGFMNLTKDTSIIVFSNRTLEESKNDDIRYPYDKWNIWDTKFY